MSGRQLGEGPVHGGTRPYPRNDANEVAGLCLRALFFGTAAAGVCAGATIHFVPGFQDIQFNKFQHHSTSHCKLFHTFHPPPSLRRRFGSSLKTVHWRMAPPHLRLHHDSTGKQLQLARLPGKSPSILEFDPRTIHTSLIGYAPLNPAQRSLLDNSTRCKYVPPSSEMVGLILITLQVYSDILIINFGSRTNTGTDLTPSLHRFTPQTSKHVTELLFSTGVPPHGERNHCD